MGDSCLCHPGLTARRRFFADGIRGAQGRARAAPEGSRKNTGVWVVKTRGAVVVKREERGKVEDRGVWVVDDSGV
jgi:hypothetical protein